MKSAPLPPTESERLKTLTAYDILDTLPEREFDDLTALAAYICKTPIALISLVDDSRQWFKSRHGLDAQQTPRKDAFCAYTILQEKPFIVPDSSQDERFADNPLAMGHPHVRFYAGAPLIAPNGERLGSLCVIDHVARTPESGQMLALECLARQVMSQLELRNSVFALKSAEKSLHSSNEQLQNALHTKALFLANMSHEIRTPMNGIIGLTDILLDSELEETQRSNLKLIESCGESLLKVINDILDFSKIESGHLQIENEPFDLVKMLHDTVGLFSSLADKKNLKLNLEIQDNIPSLLNGDRNRLRQILSNLLSNAIKFTSRGSVDVKAELVNRCDHGQAHTFQISVKDSGIGIPNHLLPKLFSSFAQATSSTNRQFGGTGLGLAISKALCENMQGAISIESTPGVGSNLFLHFAVLRSQTKSATGHEFLKRLKCDYGARFNAGRLEHFANQAAR